MGSCSSCILEELQSDHDAWKLYRDLSRYEKLVIEGDEQLRVLSATSHKCSTCHDHALVLLASRRRAIELIEALNRDINTRGMRAAVETLRWKREAWLGPARNLLRHT